MDLLSSIAVVLLLFSAAAGDVSLSGQWISGDSVFNHQNVFQIENGKENGSFVQYNILHHVSSTPLHRPHCIPAH